MGLQGFIHIWDSHDYSVLVAAYFEWSSGALVFCHCILYLRKYHLGNMSINSAVVYRPAICTNNYYLCLLCVFVCMVFTGDLSPPKFTLTTYYYN